MNQQELIPHLFRSEFRKIASVLCKTFGIEHIELAEDIAGETFLSALETWTYKGIPENPTAWLYTVAKNKARNYLQRDKVFAEKVASQLKNSPVETNAVEEIDIDLSNQNIKDSQLQMLFAICHPSISTESQIALALRILCGFGIPEIANAFLSNKETINKRLLRAKEKLRTEKIEISPDSYRDPNEREIGQRLEPVLTTLYLLFNEGYYSETEDKVLREDLCAEAMRLTELLMDNEPTDLPTVNALYALMCFHASRFPARKVEDGKMVLYRDQDESLWDQELIGKGAYHLKKASTGDKLSKYHIEANIAFWHTIKADTKEKWENILQLHNILLQIEYSPIAALNRTYALAMANSKQEAIKEAEKLQLKDNPYYFTLLGELYSDIDNKKASVNFQTAFELAKTSADKAAIKDKIDKLAKGSSNL